jgi:antirestriction protein
MNELFQLDKYYWKNKDDHINTFTSVIFTDKDVAKFFMIEDYNGIKKNMIKEYPEWKMLYYLHRLVEDKEHKLFFPIEVVYSIGESGFYDKEKY